MLGYLLRGIKPDVKHYAQVGMWEPRTCERARWMLASTIEEITRATREK